MNKFMLLALQEASKAEKLGEVPVGAVVVKDGIALCTAHNLRETHNDPTAHAEILALREAAQKLSDWRLFECDLYVTLEPCQMCASAISQARIRRLYFGAYDSQLGAAGSNMNLIDKKCEIYGGICEDECERIINDFFSKKRKLL